MKPFLPKILLLISFSFVVIFCHAQPGTLDSSFGVNGVASNLTSDGHVTSFVLQADGKSILGGYTNALDYNSDFVLTRFTNRGYTDSSFGINGVVTTHFDSLGSSIWDLAIQKDAKIIAAGRLRDQIHNQYKADFALTRYLPNGTLDSSFGLNGKVVTKLNGDEVLNAVVVQPDGKIIAAGNVDESQSVMIRYMPDGRLDSSFGANGVIYGTMWGIIDLAIQGKKIIVGGTTLTNNGDFQLARFNLAGNIDSSFGINGKATCDFLGYFDGLFSIDIDGDGSIIMGGAAQNSSTNFFIALAKFKANGIFDSTFGFNGKITTSLDLVNPVGARALFQNDGKILMNAGVQNPYINYWLRFDSKGKLDSTFGNYGKVTINTGSFVSGPYGTFQSDGKILIVGRPDYSIMRLKNDEPITVNLQRNISVTEGNSGLTPAQFKIVLNRPSAYDVQVNYTTVNGNALSGSDYIATAGKAVIKAGKTSKVIAVNVIGDNVKEKNEKFALVIGNPVNAQLGPNDTATCTIKNDDPGFASSAADAVVADTKTTGIKLYPNPVKDVLHIEGVDIASKKTISIIDMKGNVVLKGSLNGNTLNVQQLAAGVYEVRIETAGKMHSIKFVKE